jgi:hypothetical protein
MCWLHYVPFQSRSKMWYSVPLSLGLCNVEIAKASMVMWFLALSNGGVTYIFGDIFYNFLWRNSTTQA